MVAVSSSASRTQRTPLLIADAETLEEQCRQVDARVRLLEREVRQLERQVVDQEAMVAKHARPLEMVSLEKKLKKQVELARTCLQQRQCTLVELLADKRVKLAAVVDLGVDEYYDSLHDRRAASSAKAITAPAAEVQRLRSRQSGLQRTIALRKQEIARLAHEIELAETEAAQADEQKTALNLLSQAQPIGHQTTTASRPIT
mmetsp:Transcript_35637/g.76088  ORF Transcript_35637/g.76088 Transcript_35637/m.76088 type:complete len:202 (-) Transcript_35637:164-769(-)|eukprot:CAMPEP_0183338738 /NCGR_PEP_ID=MMETSP0164_2-20130417/5925_1 /TAXON_ID=221442 /ORGANISM="Coccolithus pelagicus ssp braarudi, Strain PLY182g" /LENGTH=201 /DNA_ID=CAMNT_0025508635 /DNA_START=56 /DNA_END=661 /DNA_ORIENTATION=-